MLLASYVSPWDKTCGLFYSCKYVKPFCSIFSSWLILGQSVSQSVREGLVEAFMGCEAGGERQFSRFVFMRVTLIWIVVIHIRCLILRRYLFSFLQPLCVKRGCS